MVSQVRFGKLKSTLYTLVLLFICMLMNANAHSQTVDSYGWTREKLLESVKGYDSDINIMYPVRSIIYSPEKLLLIGYKKKGRYDYGLTYILKTGDGGITWDTSALAPENKDNVFVYKTDTISGGKIWLTASNNKTYYSNDYGENWVAQKIPFSPKDKLVTVFMSDSLHGIAGGFFNSILVTDDNWQSSKAIETPYDQAKFKLKYTMLGRSSIQKIQVFDSIIMVKQKEHIYFSNRYKIDWTSFNIPVTDFDLDKAKGQWRLRGLRNRVYTLSDKLELVAEGTEVLDKRFKQRAKGGFDPEDARAFLSSGVEQVIIDSKTYDFIGLYGGCDAIPKYNETARLVYLNKEYGENKEMYFTDSSNQIKTTLGGLKMLLSEFEKGPLDSVMLDEIDFDHFEKQWTKFKEKYSANIERGDEKSGEIIPTHPLYKNYHKTIKSLNPQRIQKIYDGVIVSSDVHYADHISFILVNSQSDTLTVSSVWGEVKMGIHYGTIACWELNYQDSSFFSSSPVITQWVKSILPEEMKTRFYLPQGDLIYALISDKILEEEPYRNMNKP